MHKIKPILFFVLIAFAFFLKAQSPMMFCPGTSTAIIGGPLGYASYTWVPPAGYPLSVTQSSLSTVTITNAVPGNIYTLNITGTNNSTFATTYTLGFTPIIIAGIGASPTCTFGTSGSATVAGNGSLFGYNYSWTNSSNSVIATTSVVSGLVAGTYSVIISAAGNYSAICGTSSSSVVVTIAPQGTISLIAPYCNSQAYLSANGTNHQWYNGTTAISSLAGGTAPGYTVNSPSNGAVYWLSYISYQGCHDSIKYTLVSTPPGSLSVVPPALICSGATNGSASINLIPAPGSPPFGHWFTVVGTGTTAAYSSSLNPATQNSFTASGMQAGTYSVNAFDGVCRYGTSFTVSTYLFDFTLTPNSPTLCPNQIIVTAVTFSSAPGFGQYTYSWSPSTFLSGNAQQSTLVQPISPSGSITTIIYTVLVTPTLVNCPLSKTLSISSANPLTPSITSIPSLCASSGFYTVSANPPGGSFAGISLSPSGIISPSMAAIGLNTFTYTGPAMGTCVATSIGNFSVFAMPNLNISGNVNICTGQSTSLSVSGANSYTWSTGSTSSSLVVSPSVTSQYYVNGTHTISACSSGQTVSINVSPYPVLSVSGNTTICKGQFTTLLAGGANSYSWSNGSNSPVISLSPNLSTTYSLTGVTNPGNCSASISLTVTVLPTPTVSIYGKSSICSGSADTLIASGANTYVWANSGGNGPTRIVTPSVTSVYTVLGTDSMSCSNIVSFTVGVLASPQLILTGHTEICKGQLASILVSGADFYNWSTNASGTLIIISPTVTSTYTVIGINSNGCSVKKTHTLKVNNCTSIYELEEELSESSFYPNPASSFIHIDSKTELHFELRNAQSLLIQSGVFLKGTNKLDLQSLADGLYYLILKSDASNKSFKIIKTAD